MKTLERNFVTTKKENPYWSTLVCFTSVIKRGGFKSRTIKYWFHRLVDKQDFAKEDKTVILAYILSSQK